MGLTDGQIRVIRSVWTEVRKNTKDHGLEILIRLFEAHPDYQKHFKDFAHLPLDGLKENKKFKAHALTVMFSISSIIGSLDDAECLVALITKIGRNHAERGVTSKNFKSLLDIVVNYLVEKLGPEIMDKETVGAWNDLANTFVSCIVTEVENAS